MVMLAFLQQDIVHTYGWLTQREYVDAIALGQLTPGPVVVAAAFVGYKVLGLQGALASMVGILMPSFFMTLAVGHQLERLRANPYVRAFLSGVRPAVVGLIAGACISIGQSALVDIPAVLMAVAALVALVRFKVQPAYIIVAAAAFGAIVYR